MLRLIRKLLDFSLFIVEVIFRFFYLIVSFAIIALALYILGGYSYISGQWGTDFSQALGIAVWVNKYFPNIPFWYPLSGGGVSLTHAYPMLGYYLAAFVRSISDLSIVQSFTLLGFLSIVSMAFSIYLFVALRFKNQTAAFIASIFYLVSPISWTWLVDWGFYSESVSHIFVGPAILSWDLFFVNFINRDWGIKTRLYLFLTISFLFLAMGVHFLGGFALIRFFSFYVIGYFILSKGERKQVFLRGLTALLLVGLFSYLTTLVFSIPFNNYSKIASLSGLTGTSFEQIQQSLPSALSILGFTSYKLGDFLHSMRNFSFPSIISIFAILGIILFFFKDKRMLTFGLYALYGFTLTLSPHFWWYQKSIPVLPFLLTSGTTMREMFIVLRVVWPIMAALAITGLFSLPFFWIKNRYLQFIKAIIVISLALLLAGYSLYSNTSEKEGYLLHALNNNEKIENIPLIYNYGAKKLDFRNIFEEKKLREKLIADICTNNNYKEAALFLKGGTKRWCGSILSTYFMPVGIEGACGRQKKDQLPDICYPETLTKEKAESIWIKCRDNVNSFPFCKERVPSLKEQLEPKNWPEFKLNDNYDPDPELNKLLENIAKENPQARVDFAPAVSNLSMYAPYYNLDRSLSQMHTYLPTASLLLRFQGWQQMVFMQTLPQFKNPDLINNLAQWFGIQYMFLHSETDVTTFKKAGWESFSRGYKFPLKNSIAELSDKRTVLAIGQSKHQPYDQVLSIAFLGAIPYDDAYIVWGKDAIDDYSLNELKNFNVLLLHGYTYRNKGQANKLLRHYVEEGGNVFIDTGWQYTVPDWGKNGQDNALDIIPFKSLSWKDLGKTSSYTLEDKRFSKNIDLSKFNSLTYGDQSWGVSTAERNKLKTWAKVALSVDGFPLIATGEIGKGKIVWSGMNIFPHAKPGNVVYQEEVNFLHNLFSWFSDNKNSKDYKITFTRPHPDKVEFAIGEDLPEGGYLLWKEGYYPHFTTTLINNSGKDEKLSVYRAGPGFSLIRVPKTEAGSKIVREYKKPLSESLAFLISIITFLVLLFLVPEGLRGGTSVVYNLKNIFDKRIGYIFKRVHKAANVFEKSNEDEDY